MGVFLKQASTTKKKVFNETYMFIKEKNKPKILRVEKSVTLAD